MAATSQERNILHVKDVFSDGSMRSVDMHNNNNKSGHFMIRSAQSKGYQLSEVPVPPPRRKKLLRSQTSEEENSENTDSTHLSQIFWPVDDTPKFKVVPSARAPEPPLQPAIKAQGNPKDNYPRKDYKKRTATGFDPPARPQVSPPPPPSRPQLTSPPLPALAIQSKQLPPPPSYDSLPTNRVKGYAPPPPLPKTPPPSLPTTPLPTTPLSDFLTRSDEDLVFGEHVEAAGSLMYGEIDNNSRPPPPLITPPVPDIQTYGAATTTSSKKTGHYEKNTKANKKGKKKDAEADSSVLTNETGGSSGYYSGNDTQNSPRSQNSDGYIEQEFTMDFEADNAQRNQLFQDFGGEDFSKYIQEEHEEVNTITSRSTVKKPQKNLSPNRRLYEETGSRNRSKSPTTTDTRKKKKNTQKSPYITLDRRDKPKANDAARSRISTSRSIHQFSFMDSKMGCYADDVQMSEYISRDLETRSDLGGLKKRESTWASGQHLPSWYNDTLSATALRRAKRDYEGQFQSPSVPDLSLVSSDKRSSGSNRKRGESYSEFDADVAKKKKKSIVSRFMFWKHIGTKKKSDAGSAKRSKVDDIEL